MKGTYVTLDSAIREYCAERGDAFGNGYFRPYQHSVAWLRDMDYSNGGFKDTQYLWLPVVNGRAWVPPTINISKVGIIVGGHIQPLLEDPNMVDRPDDCGALTADLPVNPDIPSVRAGNEYQVPMINTGGWNSWGIGYGYGVNGIYGGLSWGWGSDGAYPGMGVKKSLYGYYRHFERAGYIILDADSPWTEIVIECAKPTFEAGRVTMISSIAIDAMKAYVRWKLSELDSDVDTKERPLLPDKKFEKSREKILLREKLGAQPLYEIWAVLR